MSHPLALDRRAFLASSLLMPIAVRAAQAGPVMTGLDVVIASKGEPLLGKRIGLLVHAASISSGGLHAVDALTGANVRLTRIFGAEHGFRGLAAAGEKVDDGVDAKSGLPVVSLYGRKSKPSAEDLADLDVFVIDMQDAGVRFYTYAASMMHCLDACAAAGVPVMILDRPNPIGGVRIEGPVSGPESEVPRTLLNMTPGPLAHGLTMAEIARVVNAGRDKPAKLSAVTMKGWKREMTWADTGVPWVNPSPNLRSPDACLAYPGTCMVEGTNATEGRGTDAPFLKIGAPWFKAAEMAAAVRVPGFVCEKTAFTPTSSSAAPEPKHRDAPCQGIEVRVVDRARVEPFRLGLTLLIEMKKRHKEFAWNRDGSGFDRLVGTRALRASIDRGDSVDAILASEAPAIEAFRKSREPHLLY
jgi:uncharacterized protein YbbC (DUF1343 family)